MRRWLQPLALVCGLCIGLLLGSCGGGTSVAGVGSGGSGLAGGTVSGFGSVYVDGTEIDDAQAAQVAEAADGSLRAVALKLGQRVAVLLGEGGAATRVTVEPAVTGPVERVDATGLSVLGQQVLVNTDDTQGPLTLFGGGYLSLADVAAGDTVEVHGVRLATGEVRATRIERLEQPREWLLSGPVASLPADRAEITIGAQSVSLAGASITPSLLLLEAGVQVRVWAPVGVLEGPVLAASRVRIAPPALSAAPAGAVVQYSGVVSGYDVAAGTFRLDGVPVRLSAAAAVTPALAALAAGTYVRVEGVWGQDGSLTASGVRVQSSAGEAGRVSLAGAIGTLRAANSFVVRGVAVDASGIDTAAACPGITIAAGTYVEVLATQQPGTDVAKAQSMRCQTASAIPAGAVGELRGVAGAGAARTFTLALREGGTRAVRWDDRTAFLGVDAGALAGATLIVVGTSDAGSGALLAREVRVPGARESDRFDPAGGTAAWEAYDRQFRPAPPAAGSAPSAGAGGAPKPGP